MRTLKQLRVHTRMRMYVHVRMYVYMYARNVHTYAFVLQMHHLYVFRATEGIWSQIPLFGPFQASTRHVPTVDLFSIQFTFKRSSQLNEPLGSSTPFVCTSCAHRAITCNCVIRVIHAIV